MSNERISNERIEDRDAVTDQSDTFAPPVARTDELLDREVSVRRAESRADMSDAIGAHLLPDEVVSDLRPRWADIQASFVDEPRKAVERADTLVDDAIGQLSEAFTEARSRLEQEWDRGEEVSTEDLRLALRRYRTFFDRLLDI